MAPKDTSNYGAIDIKNVDEERPLLSGKDSPSSGSSSNRKWVFGIGAIVVICGIVKVTLYPHEAKQHGMAKYGTATIGFPLMEPEEGLGLQGIVRAEDASPSSIWGNRTGPLPTNGWYLNLVSNKAAMQPDESSRVYTTPYIIDTAAAPTLAAGIRVHWPVLQASDTNIQMVNDFHNGLVLGSNDFNGTYKVDESGDLSPLGVTLQWQDDNEGPLMQTSLVRGMPFATMQYRGGAIPSVYSFNGPESIMADQSTEIQCGTLSSDNKISGSSGATVSSELKMHFINSDFTWILFFSHPVTIECGVSEGDEKLAKFLLNVMESKSSSDDKPLTLRLALLNECTTGNADMKAHCSQNHTLGEGYEDLLRESVQIVPTNPTVDFDYAEAGEDFTYINFDWKPISMSTDNTAGYDDLIMFALPHHQEQMDTNLATNFCVHTFHGRTCLVKGSKWSLKEDVSTPQSFTSRRPPIASMIPDLVEALNKDIEYRISDNMQRGAADTYFSGKILARVARVIVIAEELQALANGDITELMKVYDVDEKTLKESIEAAKSANLPSEEKVKSAIDSLKTGVQIWVEFDMAEAPYLYDSSWGGMVNCGCTYHGQGDKGICNNTFPECPALSSVNEDFGNGYYNDHHFHYGYHLYAATVVAKNEPDWGKQYFDKLLLYIRDYANPFPNDEFFTPFRQKDWFLGSSWASGIVSAENSPHGRNEESSSEAVAAYEAVALFGQVMADILDDSESKQAAQRVKDAGQLLTITEVEATNRYWHVWSSNTHNNTYPAAYKREVVGMLYETMATFQTWFAPWALVSYGIQLMPFTPVTDIRDDPEWLKLMYPVYKESCETAGDFCEENGWTIIQAGLRAAAGDREDGLKQALAVPDSVYITEGASGQSLTNTIWYIATRAPNASQESN